MALFEFELTPVENVAPWGAPEHPTLHWFALTDGTFWMPVGQATLFEYTPEATVHWGVSSSFADYPIVAFAQDILSAASAGLAPLPPLLERLAADWDSLAALDRALRARADDDAYAALRWLGERSAWTSYLTADPRIAFVRVGDQVRVHWDNEDCRIDGIPVWTAQAGAFTLSVEAFAEECRSFRDRLLDAMAARIDQIEDGRAKPRVDVAVSSLRQEHDRWRRDLTACTDRSYRPDIAWEDAESAIRKLLPDLPSREGAPTARR